jgi:hypothetical protein
LLLLIYIVLVGVQFNAAKDAYERVLKESPNHAKALQQLGWLYHSNASMGNQDIAINYLMRSIDAGMVYLKSPSPACS